MADQVRQGLALLPDRRGAVALDGGTGPVRALHPAAFTADTAAAMTGETETSADVAAVRLRWQERFARAEDGPWRGLLAAALLLDLWETDAAFSAVTLSPQDSPLTEAVLRSLHQPSLTLLVLRRGEREAVAGIADPDYALIPAADLADLSPLLPEELSWYSRAGKVFEDPCASLAEMDRLRLLARLSGLAGRSEPIDRFIAALERAGEEAADTAADSGRAQWTQRMRVLIGLRQEPAFDGLTTSPVHRLESGRCALMAALQVAEPQLPAADFQVWCWQRIPFARESAQLGAEPVQTASEQGALDELAAQEALLRAHSPAYRAALPARFDAFLADFGAALSPRLRDQLTALRQEAVQAANAIPEALSLEWPWDAAAPALRQLLPELLGEEAAEAAAKPFSELMSIYEDGTLTDARLNAACQIHLTGRPCLILPPLSREMAAYVAAHGSQGVFTPEGLRLTELALGRIRAVLMLGGSGRVHLQRDYETDEQLHMTQAPCVRLFPAVRPADHRWKYWLLSFSGACAPAFASHGAWREEPMEEASGERVFQTDTWPGCVLLLSEGRAAGALPVLAEETALPRAGTLRAGVEVGNSGISMALAHQGSAAPFSLPPLTQTLLTPAHPGDSVLPAAGLSGILPHEALLTGEEAIPFLSGAMPLAGGLAASDAQAGLLLRHDEAGEQAQRLCQREALLLLSLSALLSGAEQVRWRMALPACLTAGEGRELLQQWREASAWVSRETGLPIQRDDGEAGLRGALATAMWLRALEPAAAFAMLDIGSASTVLSVCLPGPDRPTFEKALSSGLAAMLAPALRTDIRLLTDDLGALSGVNVSALGRWLTVQESSVEADSHVWHALDQLFGAQLAEVSALMNSRLDTAAPSATQALLLFGYAARLTLLGMALEQLDRTPVLADRLPGAMRLVLTGRGTLPLTLLDERLRGQLKRFLRLAMNPRHPVRAIQWSASPACRMEAALTAAQLDLLPEGSPDTTKVGGMSLGQVAVNFLLLFRAAFPEHCALLLSPLFEPDGSLTRDAWDGVVALAQDADGDTAEDFLSIMQVVLTDTLDALRRGHSAR